MREVRRGHKPFLTVVAAVAVLITLQVIWWTTSFLNEVSVVEQLRLENRQLASSALTAAEIQDEAYHKRIMFLSESAFFLLLTFFGFYLLFRALRFERKARETERNFIDTVTHESKTPLTALKLRLEAIKEKFTEPALDKDLTLALAEVRRLTSTFEKTMALNRIERQALHNEELELGELVKETFHRLEPFLKERGVRVQFDIEPEVWVRGDSFALQNTVQNLLENAVIYNNEPQKEVLIRVQVRDRWAQLEVSDNGPGISLEDREKVFERFYRGKAVTRVPGTGLGLYLARAVVDAHQGVLVLVANSPFGKGASFLMTLPRGELA